MVKKSVNQDQPTVYHLFYADEKGDPGSDITFFEYPGVPPGPRGGRDDPHDRLARRFRGSTRLLGRPARLRGCVHRSPRGSASGSRTRKVSLTNLRSTAVATSLCSPNTRRSRRSSLFEAPGCGECVYDGSGPEREAAPRHARLPSDRGRGLGGGWRGDKRGGRFFYEPAPAQRGLSGAGTVHHIAWGSEMDEHEASRARVAEAGMDVTPVIDRFWFRSIYFREPSGVLFEIATLGPGFTTDESLETLGEALRCHRPSSGCASRSNEPSLHSRTPANLRKAGAGT